MINETTKSRLVELGRDIFTENENSQEIDKLFSELCAEADKQLEQAANLFVTHYGPDRIFVSPRYRKAHEALLKASMAASKILELRENLSLRRTYEWWNMLDELHGSGELGRYARAVTQVVDAAVAAEAALAGDDESRD